MSKLPTISAFICAAAFLALIAKPGICRAAGEVPAVSLVTDATIGGPASHGAEKLLAGLKAKGVSAEQVRSLDEARGSTLIVAGIVSKPDPTTKPASTTKPGPVDQLLAMGHQTLPQGPESLVISKTTYGEKPTWIIAGADETGLMYGELDAADRIGWSADPSAPLSELRETSEKPAIARRGITLFLMNRAYWESRFYDEAYWTRYFDTLAENRFNSILLTFGYEDGGFLAPCYPYFFDTEGFPDVRMVGITREQQQKNLDALNRLVQMAHERGIHFNVGIWDHIYRGGVQAGGTPNPDAPLHAPTPGLVWGVTADNLIPYTKAALTKFLRLVPNIDGIQFRMHDESGLKVSEQPGFWREIFQLMKDQAPQIKLDLRAKGLPDAVIQNCLETGLNFEISTKYWMEQMGLPFHPTHVNQRDQLNRRHGYADLLHYPPQYKMTWQLWNGGTARVLLFADPEYARRFCETTHLYDSDGFDIDEPLATKMEGQPHNMKPFDLMAPQYRYYDYEFERYWHLFQVFGRIGYSPEASPEIWNREFARRFGVEAAAPIEDGLHKASWILPRIVASSYPYSAFPMTVGWAEKQHFGDLPVFAKAEGSDTEQFENFDEAAQRLIEHGETTKVRAEETSRWFFQTSQAVMADIEEAQRRMAGQHNKEFDSTMVDLRMLANLALYYSRRIPAAVSYRLFVRTKDPAELDDAIAGERSAIDAWKEIVAAAGDVYAPDLMMGAQSHNLCGHWREELASMEKGLTVLENQRAAVTSPATQPSPRYEPIAEIDRPTVIHDPVLSSPVGRPITIEARVRSGEGIKWVRLRYRNVNQYLDYKMLPMLPTDSPGLYRATVPAEEISPRWDFMYFLEIMDERGNGVRYPDMDSTSPYVIVRLIR